MVDLDHSLIHCDMMVSSIKWLVTHKPLHALLVPFWLFKGKGFLKDALLKQVKLKVADLSYNQTVIDYIKARKSQGHRIILATASAQYYADEVLKYLNTATVEIFDEAYGTKNGLNLSSQNKADFLVKKYGKKNFDYMGDHKRDLPVWAVSKLSIIVNANHKLKQQTQHLNSLYLLSSI